jgi:predicted DNA-binding protein (MmcQ/YjbR family)
MADRRVTRAGTNKRAQSTQESLDVGARTAALMKCLESKPGAVANPMGAPKSKQPLVLIYKIMGKMFAILSVRGAENVILKCDPNLAQSLREQYAGVGHRSHLDRRFWISVSLDADVPADEIERLAGHSYELVRSGLTRKQRAELDELAAVAPQRGRSGRGRAAERGGATVKRPA